MSHNSFDGRDKPTFKLRPFNRSLDRSTAEEEELGDIMTETWPSAIPHRLGPSDTSNGADNGVSVSV